MAYKLNIEIQFYLFIYLLKLIILIENHYYSPFFSQKVIGFVHVDWLVGFIVFNATFNTISVIS